VTVAGTEAELEFDDRATTAPPNGEGSERVTVPVIDPPPDTDVADRVTLFTCTCGGAAPFWTET
jgi:hypothetical protein